MPSKQFSVGLKLGHSPLSRILFAVSLLLFSVRATGQVFTVLYSFDDAGRRGAYPYGGVAIDQHGNIFGTTSTGGTYRNGTVYELNPSGAATIVHNFYHSEGASPMDTPLLTSNGNLIGTTNLAGKVSGTVWELFKGGKLAVLHQFSSDPSDGRNPYAGVTQDGTGNSYGTAPYGGGHGYGAVFKVDSHGNETIFYSFTGLLDGSNPFGGVSLGKNGTVYGTTQIGGAMNYGTVYKLSSTGTETTLHSFTKTDGEMPTGNLTGDQFGNVYGTTYEGGAYSSGVIFKVTPAGGFSVLYDFGGTSGDGSLPYAGVVRDASGNLYGTTSGGGLYFQGCVYKFDPSNGSLTVLHSFTGGTDGGYPFAGVTLDSTGNLYGTAIYGGNQGYGVVYKVTP